MSLERIHRMPYDSVREGRRRLFVGLSGLFAMLLLVVLVSWLTSEARQEADLARAQAQAAGVANPGSANAADENSSLADLGVAPALNSDDRPAVPKAQPPIPQVKGNGLVVPDLQPDPQLDPAKSRR